MYNVVVVLNADGRSISKSETFIHSHIDSLKTEFNVTTLVGNPGQRKILEEGKDFQSLHFFARAIRKLLRLLRRTTVRQQDNAALAKFFKKRNIRCCFAEYGMSGVGVMEVCRQLDTPLLVHFHGYDAYRHDLLKKYRSDYYKMFQIAEGIIAVSKDMKGKLEREIGFGEKIIHSSCGFNSSILSNSETISKQPNTVTFVGRLTPKKDPVGLIRAFAAVVAKIPRAQLTIVGDGELRSHCEKTILELNLQGNVTLLGWRGHEEVLRILERSTAFAMNSVTAENGDKEGTPVAIMEAMALKNIVVATRHGGIVDIIEDGRSGLLYPEFDYELLSRQMIAALSGACDPALPDIARQYAISNLSASLKNQFLNTLVLESIEKSNSSL